MIREAESDDTPEVQIGVVEGPQMIRQMVEADPFAVGGSEGLEKVRGLEGLDPNFKKRLTRLEKRYESVDGEAKSQALEPEVYTAYATLDLIQPPHNVEYLAALYNMSPILRAAIAAKVSAIVGMGYDLVETNKVTDKIEDAESQDEVTFYRKKVRKIKNQIQDRIDNANREMTFTKTLTRVWTDVESLGFGCLEIGRKANGEIGYVGHIPAKTVRVRRKRDGYVQMIANKAVFFRNFGDTTTTNPIGNDERPNEMLFFVGGNYSPDETYYGTPGAVAAKQAIAGNEFSGRFNLDYFENKALPRYVFVVKGARLNADSEKKLAGFFENMKGQNHRTLIVPLPADTDGQKYSFEMKPVETGVQDSSFANYRRGNMQEILMAYRVPANKIGLSDVDNGAARDLSKNFSETVSRPEQKDVEFSLNRIIREWTDIVKIKFKETALSDDTELAKQDQIYLQGGVMTPNDVRRRWSWAPIEDGDETLVDKEAKAAKQAANNATANRQRNNERAANSSDSIGEARNAKGQGRAQD